MIYSFENKITGEEYSLEMKYEELEKYLKENTQVNQTFHLHVGDSVRLGVTKPPSDFQKGVVDRIAHYIPGNTIRENQKFSTPREW